MDYWGFVGISTDLGSFSVEEMVQGESPTRGIGPTRSLCMRSNRRWNDKNKDKNDSNRSSNHNIGGLVGISGDYRGLVGIWGVVGISRDYLEIDYGGLVGISGDCWRLVYGDLGSNRD